MNVLANIKWVRSTAPNVTQQNVVAIDAAGTDVFSRPAGPTGDEVKFAIPTTASAYCIETVFADGTSVRSTPTPLNGPAYDGTGPVPAINGPVVFLGF